MIPKSKVETIISKHATLEKELSSGTIDSKLYTKKSIEYSELSSVINFAKILVNYERDKKDLEVIINDKSSVSVAPETPVHLARRTSLKNPKSLLAAYEAVTIDIEPINFL